MRILILTTYYAPDLGPGAALFTMLCEDLARLGHQVSVLAAVPHYPTGTVPAKYRGRLFQREVRNGVNVTRVWVPTVNRSKLSLRLLTFVVYQLLSTMAGLALRYDIVLAGNPALEVFLPFAVLSVLRRRPAIFSIHDLYPDIGVRLGIFRHKPVIRLVGWMEDFCIKHARFVRVLSEGFRRAILARGVAESKIVLVWDWLDPRFIRPMPRSNALSAQWNLDDRVVVLYAGNMSFSQGLEQILEAASRLSTYTRIQFVLVGGGAAKRTLEERAQRDGLRNVQFFDFRPQEELPLVLATADISIICLKWGVSSDSVPSKFYSILASGRPVIAAVDPESDTSRLVQRARCGICVPPEQPEDIAQAVLDLYHDQTLRGEMGNNGREYVVANHGRAAAAHRFHELIVSMDSAGRDRGKATNFVKEESQ
jgi:colanic acid biosynthesis glycosyl transferase WcaI